MADDTPQVPNEPANAAIYTHTHGIAPCSDPLKWNWPPTGSRFLLVALQELGGQTHHNFT
jgi:hypothetical protein